MKIADVKPDPVRIGHRKQMLVKVETDSGLDGWGEGRLSGCELAVAGAVQHHCEVFIGRDPQEIGGLRQKLYRSQYFEGGRVPTAAISAIERGKAEGRDLFDPDYADFYWHREVGADERFIEAFLPIEDPRK